MDTFENEHMENEQSVCPAEQPVLEQAEPTLKKKRSGKGFWKGFLAAVLTVAVAVAISCVTAQMSQEFLVSVSIIHMLRVLMFESNAICS